MTSKAGVKWAQDQAYGVKYWKPVGTTDKKHMNEQKRAERAGKKTKKRKASSKKTSKKASAKGRKRNASGQFV